MVFIFVNAAAQEKSKKQIKEEQKQEKQKQIALLVESKEFVFVVNRIIPQAGRNVKPSSTYVVEFYPELINSYLPFFGTAYGGIGYGGDSGMVFESKPSVYTVEKKKKEYQIKAEVKAKNDTFSLFLTVSFEGYSNLTVNSNNLTSISYSGEIGPIKSNKK